MKEIQQKSRKRYHFKFSYEDIATATGYSINTLKQKAHKGDFNPRDIFSLSMFIAYVTNKRAAKVLSKKKDKPVTDITW